MTNTGTPYLPVLQSNRLNQIDKLVRKLHPSYPLHLFSRLALHANARRFIESFPGTVMYAVKSNPDEDVVTELIGAGITTFDAASIDEVRLIRRISSSARIHFMHTVKSREAIREAYFDHGVRVFVTDTLDELHKIIHETDLANDLEIYVRLALPKNKEAAVDFSAKFGASPKGAALLLHEARLVASRLGIMFHPGTQSTNPEVYARGIALCADVIRSSGVRVDALDVGGGFPAAYPGTALKPFDDYMATIRTAIHAHGLDGLTLYCEPGRALVADAGFLLVRVEQRKDKALYLNDGVYGGLTEAARWQGDYRFPATFIARHPDLQKPNPDYLPFRFCGPTCDSLDMMKGPFELPSSTTEGDWILVGLTGAYSNACRTDFNGFGHHRTLMID